MDILDRLLFNAQTIASIPKGKRINTRKKFICLEPDVVLQPLWRWSSAESRERDAEVVTDVVDTLILISKLLIESKWITGDTRTDPVVASDAQELRADSRQDPPGTRPDSTTRAESKRLETFALLKRIYISLVGIVPGIENLCHTYSDDANMVGDLTPNVANINGHLTLLKKFLQDQGVIETM